MIREFTKGQHAECVDLEEEYLDWFFLHHFNKSPDWWRNLDDDKIVSLMTLEKEKEQEYWNAWVNMFKQMFGSK